MTSAAGRFSDKDALRERGNFCQFIIPGVSAVGFKRSQRCHGVASAKANHVGEHCGCDGLAHYSPLSIYVPHHDACQHPDALPFLALSAGLYLPANSTADLAVNADGRPFSLHPCTSVKCPAGDPEITTGRTPDAGQLTPEPGNFAPTFY